MSHDKKILRINPRDNVAVALTDLSNVSLGHKLCVTDIPKGNPVIKYGAPIGLATCDIKTGEHVHTHNLKTALGPIKEYVYQPIFKPVPPRESGSFQGFKRSEGNVGIRNEIWIVPTVGCVNGIAEQIARRAQSFLPSGIDGLYAFPHPYGCSQLGDDHENTKKALSGLIRHPNAGGVLVLGLGCENNTIDGMREFAGDYDSNRVKFLICQEHDDEIEAALALIRKLITFAAAAKREQVPMSKLIIGLKCGGSDGLSGITANPLVGALSDRLIAEGGAAILSEVPEMFGAETILMNRCQNEEIFRRTVALINDFKEYFTKHDQVIYENPSPGNKAGGITTLEEKSLGCTQKGGVSPVTDVLRYGQSIQKTGLNLLQAPGNDLVAATAEAISGAHLILFTTGRGTPFGAPVPTVKISSNTRLFDKKRNWIDFDAGRLVNGADLNAESDSLYQYIKAVASGKRKTKTEKNGIRDMAIFKNGVTL
jgi:altronate hydrolase